MNQILVKESFNKLKEYCEKEGYMGWDPYDGLNSVFFNSLPKFISGQKWPRIFITQLLKHSPINFRKILFVRKGLNPKGIALFLTGYCNLYHIYNEKEIKEKIFFLADSLLNLETKGFSGSCWGYNFPWQSRAFYQKRYSPTVVVSCFAGYALLDAYDITNEEKYLNSAISIKEFVLSDLNRKLDNEGDLIFSYSPFDTTEVINASLLGAKILSRIYGYTKEKDLIITAKKAVSYACKLQAQDGSWPYGALSFQNWIDSFHTGFNLEAIFEYQKYSQDFSFKENIKKGVDYYLNNFILEDGTPKYYNNKTFPIDIHCPSQFVSTFAEMENFHPAAEKTLLWTIANMQDKKGYFYFQKKKFWTIKTSYMRWSQAWVFYSMTKYLKLQEKYDQVLHFK